MISACSQDCGTYGNAVGAVLAAAWRAAPALPRAGRDGLRHVNAGMPAIVDGTPLYVTPQHGPFDENALAVTPMILKSGEQTTQKLLSGQLPFTFSNYLTAILTAGQGAPLRLVADGTQ